MAKGWRHKRWGGRSKNTWKVVLENNCAHANELRACHYLQQVASIEVLTDQPTFLTNYYSKPYAPGASQRTRGMARRAESTLDVRGSYGGEIGEYWGRYGAKGRIAPGG